MNASGNNDNLLESAKALFRDSHKNEAVQKLAAAYSAAPNDRGNVLEIVKLCLENKVFAVAILILRDYCSSVSQNSKSPDVEALELLNSIQFEYIQDLELKGNLSATVDNLHLILKTFLRDQKINIDTLQWEIMGGLATDAALFPKLKAAGSLKTSDPIFLCGEPANPPLVNLISRAVPVAHIPALGRGQYLGYLAEKSQYFLLVEQIKEKLFGPLYKNTFDDCFNFYHSNNGRGYFPNDAVPPEIAERPEVVTFSDEETRFCRNYLRDNLNIPDGASWVCIYARDPGYYGESENDGKFFRNASLKSYFPTIGKIIEDGTYVVRVGSNTPTPLGYEHQRVVDYAFKFQNQMVDLFLIANCLLLLGTPSGLSQVAYTFKTQCLNVHTINFFPSWGELYIPKKPVDAKSGKPLDLETFFNRTYRNPDFLPFWEDGIGQQAKLGIRYVENSPEEVLDAYEEYKLRKCGAYSESREEQELLGKFNAIISNMPGPYPILTPISSRFLVRNSYLFSRN